jgi:hypothetical protein
MDATLYIEKLKKEIEQTAVVEQITNGDRRCYYETANGYSYW